jgi:hypothetical protein
VAEVVEVAEWVGEEESWESGESDRAGLGCVAGGGDRGGEGEGLVVNGRERGGDESRFAARRGEVLGGGDGWLPVRETDSGGAVITVGGHGANSKPLP